MRTLRRLLIGLLAALTLTALAVALSIPLGWELAPDRVAALTNVRVPGGGAGAVAAYLARPPGEGPFPAVVMIHEFWGLREDIVRKADALAEEGYVVLAPDTMRGRSTAWLPTAIYQTATQAQEDVNADLDAVFAWLAARPEVDPERVAVIGFCYGGRMALRYGLHNPQVALIGNVYGETETDVARLRALPGPLLGIFGAEDRMIPLADVRAFERALEAAGATFEVTVYEGVGHAFIDAGDPRAAGGAQAAAWAQIVRFLARHL
ncbi:dienelactone hydrolase family protein [Truepera radiovictrix]|uniref:Carboxymethylenebutenolidase n=1 Tax=Truepera radiovictrix (strain DSM 17093 / CIP 108686 / LMG 22925 / RQ-24) TaxID=649638 RepID=D7CSV1_TRURR|nr:dienelactone hydrolase family protein [Truepera radiovictrix]ADI13718.1 Carboxymethylenebutenolidase [Truepera radiovictrix DSM 17093]WMT57717.1 dienelactone hydrolase family protein [Truepera radiovictrix]